MSRDLNEEVRRSLDEKLDRATCKGVIRLKDDEITLVFEQYGSAKVIELQILADHEGPPGLILLPKERR